MAIVRDALVLNTYTKEHVQSLEPIQDSVGRLGDGIPARK